MHTYNYMCNTGVYPTHVELQGFYRCISYTCNTHVELQGFYSVYPTHILHV